MFHHHVPRLLSTKPSVLGGLHVGSLLCGEVTGTKTKQDEVSGTEAGQDEMRVEHEEQKEKDTQAERREG